ncbi:MAG: hypothetical protein K6G48_03490, partial [Acholeplasmatales bacterium]|nr:hypothetical protein [Acholeplasmatales bacterium]
AYINPSNLMPKATSAAIEANITGVTVTDPDRSYPDPADVVTAINSLTAVNDITNDNYVSVGEAADAARLLYNQLNIDDRASVTNLSTLEAVEAKVAELVEANKPQATAEYTLDCSTLTSAGTGTYGDYTISDANSKFSISSSALKLGGSGSSSSEYVSITVTGTGTVTIVVNAYITATDKVATLGITQDSKDAVTQGVTTGNSTAYTFDFTISGTSTFYIYRAAGSSTGIYIDSIVTSYYAA